MIDATLAVVANHRIRPEDVKSVRVRTYSIAQEVAGNPSPRTVQQAKFSIPYCVAVAIRCGKVGTPEFSQSLVEDAQLRDLLRRVEVVSEPELSALAPARRPSIVEITIQTGEICSERKDFRKGDPGESHPERT